MAYFGGTVGLIQSTVPSNGAQDVPLGGTIQILFTKDMVPETISGATIVLLDDGFNKVQGTVTYAGRIATFAPTGILVPGTRYQVIVKAGTSGVLALDGTRLSTDYNFNFTTQTTGMLGAPSLVAPADQSVVTGNVAFSWGSVDGASGYEFVISQDPTFGSIYFEQHLATTSITPDVPFLHDVTYYWRVRAVGETPGAWSAGRQFRYYAVVPQKAYVPFDIADTSPGPDTIGVAVDTTISVVFTDDVDPTTLDGSITLLAEDLDGVGEPVAVPGLISATGKKVEFAPLEPLKANTLYKVTVSRSVASLSGATLDDDVRWSFASVLRPYYSSIALVRNEIGEFISAIPDLDIAMVIRDVSLWADQISARPYGSENSDFAGDTQPETTNKIFFHQYTRYESAIRLLSRRVLEHAQYHSETQQIGDLTVRKAGSMTPDVNLVLKRLEALRDKAQLYLTMGDQVFPLPTFAVKGNQAYPYPLEARRSF